MRIQTLTLHGLLTVRVIAFFALVFTSVSVLGAEKSSPDSFSIVDCDNLTDGGLIEGDEVLNSDISLDPALITNISLPSGGSGDLEYLWIYTTDDPTISVSEWTPISGTNSPEYDPGVISQTTHYRRCSRRSGCVDYIAESNYVTKTVIICDNIIDGGIITASQAGSAPYQAETLQNLVLPLGGSGGIEYQWYSSEVGPPFGITNPDWVLIPDSNSPFYEPGILNDTTYFIRLARRENCEEYTGVSNFVTIIVNPTECDNVTEGGMIAFDQESCGSFLANEIQNTVFPAGGSGDLEYLWFQSTTTSVFIDGSPDWQPIPNSNTPNLNPGLIEETTHFIRCVRRSACEEYAGESNVITITINPLPLVLADEIANVTCLGEATGSIDISVSGGTAPYQYDWNNGFSNTADIENLSAGTYTVSVSDSLGCGTLASFEVTENEAYDVSFTVTEPSCVGAEDGMVVAEITGGFGMYNNTWNDSNGQTGDTLMNVGAGTYILQTIDSICSLSNEVVVNEPALAFTVELSVQDAACQGTGNGSIAVNVSPVGNYTYLWDDENASDTPSLNNVPSGTYTVTVTNEDGCTDSASAVVSDNAGLELNLSATPEACGLSNGTAAVEVTGGTAPYSVIWNDENESTTTMLSGLSGGVYAVTVTDGNGCSASEEIQVEAETNFLVSMFQQSISCFGENDGFAIATPQGGTGPYTYEWTNASSTNNTAAGLGVGVYAVTVTDFNGCTGITEFEITEPVALETSVAFESITCENDLTDVEVFMSGGLAPYYITWNTGSTASILNAVGAGDYSVTIADSNGCTVSESINITPTSTLSINVDAQNVSCAGAEDGQVSAQGVLGVAPYSYEWNTGATEAELQNIGAGTYFVSVTDADGCMQTTAVTVTEPALLQAQINVVTPVSSSGANDGEVLAGVSGGTAPYSYLWSDGSSNTTLSGLAAGTYSLTVTDVQGCSVDAEITLLEELGHSVSVGDYVWADTNGDGIQQSYETGVGGVLVNLISASDNSIVTSQMTSPSGYYLFEDVAPGMYLIEFDLASLPLNTILTIADYGNNDEVDSDANTETGRTEPFVVLESQPDNLSFDAGVRPACSNIEYGGLIGPDQHVCQSELPAEIGSIELPAGGTGNIEYLWLVGTTNVYTGPGDSNWSEIPNSNSPVFQPPMLSGSTYYIRCARRENCSDYSGETNIVALHVAELPYADIVEAPSISCMNQPNVFEAAPAPGGVSYLWDFDEGAVPATANTREVENVSWTSPGVKNVALTLTTEHGCSSSVYGLVEVENCNGLEGQISDFTATINGVRTVSLQWSTSGSDTEARFFINAVRPGTGITTIAVVNGRVEEGLVNQYQFVDEDPALGVNSYQIRRVQNDGEHQSSEILSVNFLPEGTPELKIYPNPFDSEFTINVLQQQSEPMLMRVYSPQGHLILAEELATDIVRQRYNLSDYPSGMYIVKIYYGAGKETVEKIFKR